MIITLKPINYDPTICFCLKHFRNKVVIILSNLQMFCFVAIKKRKWLQEMKSLKLADRRSLRFSLSTVCNHNPSPEKERNGGFPFTIWWDKALLAGSSLLDEFRNKFIRFGSRAEVAGCMQFVSLKISKSVVFWKVLWKSFREKSFRHKN